MKKELLLAVVMLVSLIALQACSTITTPRQKAVYTDKMAATIEEVGGKATIVITEKGDLLFYDAKGEPLKPCVLPTPDTETKQSSAKSTETECQGMMKGSAVTNVQSLSILKSNSLQCITFGPDAAGHYYQYCWEVP